MLDPLSWEGSGHERPKSKACRWHSRCQGAGSQRMCKCLVIMGSHCFVTSIVVFHHEQIAEIAKQTGPSVRHGFQQMKRG